MLLMGESINGTRKQVAEAIQARDAEFIKTLAQDQIDAGAGLLDVNGGELGVITKKWAGIGRELFTSADNYMISLSETAATQAGNVVLLLAAGLAIDVVFKEKE